MEIFNVSIPELVLIAGLALVVFGPERLPEIGRILGKQVARLLAWQQNSPELQMLNEVRGEFEREIASLRDELVRTRRQLDVSQDISAIKQELRPMLDLRGALKSPAADEPAIAPPRPADSMSPVEVVPPDEAVEEAIGAPDAITPTPAAQTVPAAARPTKIPATEPTNVLAPPIPPPAPEPDAAEPGAPELVATAESAADIDSQLARRLQQLVADMQALVSELQERGHLSPDWQPPAPAPQQETVSR